MRWVGVEPIVSGLTQVMWEWKPRVSWDTIKLSGCRTQRVSNKTFQTFVPLGHKEDKKIRERAAAHPCITMAVVSVKKIWPQASNALSETKTARDMVLKFRLANV